MFWLFILIVELTFIRHKLREGNKNFMAGEFAFVCPSVRLEHFKECKLFRRTLIRVSGLLKIRSGIENRGVPRWGGGADKSHLWLKVCAKK